MKDYIEERAVEIAYYIIENKVTCPGSIKAPTASALALLLRTNRPC